MVQKSDSCARLGRWKRDASPPRNLHMMLRALPPSVRTARGFVRSVLKELQLEQAVDNAELVTSELVTNSVRYAGEGVSWVMVSVYACESHVLLEIWDQSPGEPVLREEAGLSEGGRGLEIVEALSARWGCRWPKVGGKSVWCELTTDLA